MRSLKGKIAVVTGAGSGIGRATALALCQRGVRVHLTDIDGSALAETSRQCDGAGVPHAVDSADGDAVARLADAVFAAEGRVDILHNNAGVCWVGAADTATLDDWRWLLGINLWGVIHGLTAFLPRMLHQGGGVIVNTASMAGLTGLPFVVPYCTSKFAIVGLSEALDVELRGRGVRVIAACPGAVRTGLFGSARSMLPRSLRQAIDRGVDRVGADPARVAAQIVAAVAAQRGGLLLPAAGEMLPLYLLKRASQTLYEQLIGSGFALVHRWQERQVRGTSRPAGRAAQATEFSR
jgi:NAD(P)-dependent dehydrogenase (short-subunit alcohol dehydrogenase family)